jgi:hypothetical protein
MKKILLILGFLFFATVLLSLAFFESQPFAAAPLRGCCKQRQSDRHPWRDNGKNFNQCEALNQKLDGDNIFRENGRVWWDRGC